MQIHNHVTVIPTISADGSGPDYLTMKEAMEGQFLMVTELTEGELFPGIYTDSYPARIVYHPDELIRKRVNP
jgi:hypothetical protein